MLRHFASRANIFFKNNFSFLDTDEPAKNGITGPKSFRGFRETGPQRAYNANRFIVIILRLLPRGIYVMQALKLQAVTHMSNLVVVFFLFSRPRVVNQRRNISAALCVDRGVKRLGNNDNMERSI